MMWSSRMKSRSWHTRGRWGALFCCRFMNSLWYTFIGFHISRCVAVSISFYVRDLPLFTSRFLAMFMRCITHAVVQTNFWRQLNLVWSIISVIPVTLGGVGWGWSSGVWSFLCCEVAGSDTCSRTLLGSHRGQLVSCVSQAGPFFHNWKLASVWAWIPRVKRSAGLSELGQYLQLALLVNWRISPTRFSVNHLSSLSEQNQ